MMLTLKDSTDAEEHKRVLERGYQRAVGMLLWSSRLVHVASLYTVQQLCKVMSKPTEEAWKVAMHLIAYQYRNKSQGIQFHSDGNTAPIVMADASNRGDPIDSKRAYGVAAMWMGGPVITVSKKLEHSSSATAANEYMALSHATKHTIWLRYLLQDMGLGDMLDGPTVLYGDNKTANQWVTDDKISQGNMWILQSYHYVKEMGPEGENQIVVHYAPSKFNIADVYTKGVARQDHDFLVPYLCGHSPIGDLLKEISDAATSNAKLHSGDIPGPLRTEMIKDQGGQSNGHRQNSSSGHGVTGGAAHSS